MTGVTRVSGMLVAGLLSLAVGLERFINTALAEGAASYASTRFVIASICTATGVVLLVVDAVRGHGPRRRKHGGHR